MAKKEVKATEEKKKEVKTVKKTQAEEKIAAKAATEKKVAPKKPTAEKTTEKTVEKITEKTTEKTSGKKAAAKPEKKIAEKKVSVKKPSEKKVPEIEPDKKIAEAPEIAEGDLKFDVTPVNSVLFVASEANPYLGSGGLADVIGSLPKTLAANGKYDVRVVMPLYGDISDKYRSQMRFLMNFNVPLAWRNQYCGVFTLKADGVTFYFIDNEYYFKRSGLYGFYDDGERFAYFSKAALEMMVHLDYYPEILHCHDWQAALSVIFLKTLYANRYGYDHIKALFTIHNIEYQGKYGYDCLGDLFGLPESVKPALDYNGCLNLMKGAIQFSDRFSTVSRMYANEIKNPFFAHGLQYVICENEFKLTGILNGIDETVYNPETDEKLFRNYSADDTSGKAVCKKELQKMLGLPEKDDAPLISIISRLVPAKGIDLVKCVIEELLAENVQVVILGKGEGNYEDYFRMLADRYSGKCRAIIAYNKDLASKIYSASDIFLMPSKQEPCGLSQMIACRYGAVPVVRATGGLFDSISPYNNDMRNGGNGFVFGNYNAHEMLYVIKDAVYTYGNKDEWRGIVKRAMTSDFSWEKSSGEYEKLYDNMLGEIR
ncbi:MAG: glycogen synthase GlgA [Candidatus Borkfalkiaceae bacterium]|nr:glycogen synthase GlgA [Christensenellaceae bacterium]